MKRIAIYFAAAVAALVPAVVGLWGNASFARGVSHDLSRPAVSARHTGADDGAQHAAREARHHAAKARHHAQHAEAGDDRGHHHGGSQTGDDKGPGGHGADD